MGEIYKSLKKKAKDEDGGDAGNATEAADEDSARRIYKLPTQKNEFDETPMVAEEVKRRKRKGK